MSLKLEENKCVEEQGEGGADHRPGGMVDFIDTDTSDSIDKVHCIVFYVQ